MTRRPAILGVTMLAAFGAFHAQAQSPTCTNSLLSGTYFYLSNGAIVSGGQTEPFAELTKYVFDGQGNLAGQAEVDEGGTFAPVSFSGTYTVQASCQGSLIVTVNSTSTAPFYFEVVNGGEGILMAASSSAEVVVGQAYQASAGLPNCGNGSFTGSYGFLLSGTSGGLLFSEEGQVVSDGNGNLNLTAVINSNGNVTQIPANGTYSVAADCSGTARFTSQSGTSHYQFAVVQNGRSALFLATDAGTTVSGTAQSQDLAATVLPQFVFGGGWSSAIYFANTTSNAVSFLVTFIGDDGNPMNVPSVGGSSATVNLAPNGSTSIQTTNVGAQVQGYVSAALPAGVTGYGVFDYSVPGASDQEAVVPLSSASATSSTLVWDDTNFLTAVAIVNPSPVATNVNITLLGSGGTILGTSTVALGPRSKVAVILRTLPGLAGMVGNQGIADFTVASGNVAVMGIRYNGGAYTSIPTTQK